MGRGEKGWSGWVPWLQQTELGPWLMKDSEDVSLRKSTFVFLIPYFSLLPRYNHQIFFLHIKKWPDEKPAWRGMKKSRLQLHIRFLSLNLKRMDSMSSLSAGARYYVGQNRGESGITGCTSGYWEESKKEKLRHSTLNKYAKAFNRTDKELKNTFYSSCTKVMKPYKFPIILKQLLETHFWTEPLISEQLPYL